MPVRAFLDTNVLIYAFSSNDPRKDAAKELVVQGGTIGIQTLNEFVNVVTGRLKKPWTDVEIWLKVIDKLCPEPVPLTLSVHRVALEIARGQRFHIYDSLMLAAALEASCTVFYSEDMQDGQEIGGMVIRNPFR